MREYSGLPAYLCGNNETGDLVRRAQDGDPGAFGVLYEGTVERVYDICLRISGNTSDAEDLTQEVYIRCWEKLSLFSGDGRFIAWLHRLTVNHALNKLYQAKRIDRWQRPIENIDSLQGPGSVGTADIRVDLERALSRLSDNARRMLMCKYVTGYRYTEMARMEDLAVGTLKSQVHRARKSAVDYLDRGESRAGNLQ